MHQVGVNGVRGHESGDGGRVEGERVQIAGMEEGDQIVWGRGGGGGVGWHEVGVTAEGVKLLRLKTRPSKLEIVS